MTWNNNIVSEPSDNWGGPWTEKKLDAFSKYVWSYLKIMEKNPYWETIYFDGFVGSGTKDKTENSEFYLQFKITEEEEKTYKGAAERVLDLKDNMSFDYYYFIDKCKDSLDKLEAKLTKKLGNENKNLVFRSGDANQQLAELSKALKKNKYAALILLDPFGMQINWNSIEQLKGTRSDMWILVPTGVIINRLLDKKGKLQFSDKLESFFGLPIDDIKSHFYKEEKVNTLFGEEEIITKDIKPIQKIAKIYASRMQTIWKYVTDEPLVLCNRSGVPLFHFIFASNNIEAKKIAKQIIKSI